LTSEVLYPPRHSSTRNHAMNTIALFARRVLNAPLCATVPLLLAAMFSSCPAPAAPPGSADALAREVLRRADMTRGVCAVLSGEGELPVALARASGLLVHVREPEAARVDALRAEADRAGFDIQRLAVERGELDRLPYATNSVDIIFCARANAAMLGSLSAGEVLRALRPEGTAIMGAAPKSCWR